MAQATIPSTFRDANYNPVPYDGSPVRWRVSIYGISLDSKQNILLVKHVGEKFWDVPGGGIEINETPEQALLREGLEEAGAALKLTNIFAQATDWFFHGSEQRYYRSLQLFGHATIEHDLQKPTDSRVEAVKFFAWPEAKKKMYPHVADLLSSHFA